jgi:hypothetical protein
VPVVRQKLHLSACADFRDRLSGRASNSVLYAAQSRRRSQPAFVKKPENFSLR